MEVDEFMKYLRVLLSLLVRK